MTGYIINSCKHSAFVIMNLVTYSYITNRFAALGNIRDDGDINRACEDIKENIKTSAKESLGLHKLKQHKPWFDEECLYFLDERKQAKL